MNTTDEDEIIACLEVCTEQFVLKKVNLLNLLCQNPKAKAVIKACFKENFQYLQDETGNVPFDYCLSYNNFEAIRYIQEEIEHMRAPMDFDSFQFSLELYNDSSLSMIMNGLFQKTNILGKDSVRGEFRGGLEEKLFLSEDEYLYEGTLAQLIDFDVMHKKPINSITSRVDLTLTPGSSGSLALLELIQNADDEIVYRSELNFFVDYKWE